jgi:hypothetical protein
VLDLFSRFIVGWRTMGEPVAKGIAYGNLSMLLFGVLGLRASDCVTWRVEAA